MNRKLLITLFLCHLVAITCRAAEPSSLQFQFSNDLTIEEFWADWSDTELYFTMVTPDNQIIMETKRVIYPGDQYLTADNLLYEVTEVDEQMTAHTQLIEEVKLEEHFFNIQQLREALGLSVAEAQTAEHTGKIGIYHTHNAESYVPTDGVDSINGKGGIHAVGQAFANSLEQLGVDVTFNENLHLPHDKGAYRRSRNTVLQLLAQEPDAIFDLHRDAAPMNAYAALIKEEWVTQIQFVVGRQNQNLGVNRQYAQSLKKIADQVYPGLVKGIFYGRGNYNQDLTPLNLLLEVGAHTNSKDAAVRGISLLAEVVDFYFYGPVEDREEQSKTRAFNLSASRTTIGIIVFLGLALIIFYIINAGGWQAAINRLLRRK